MLSMRLCSSTVLFSHPFSDVRKNVVFPSITDEGGIRSLLMCLMPDESNLITCLCVFSELYLHKIKKNSTE